MIDHVALNVSDLESSKAFYVQALEPLGFSILHEIPEAIGMGPDGQPILWLVRRDPVNTAVHVAFAASDRAAVDAFHAAALDADGTDHGAPGVREQYHPHYYGAFVLDPDGNNVEAVCHAAAATDRSG